MLPHYQEAALMKRKISNLALMAALVAATLVSLPSEALAQYGHHYGHYYGHGYGYSRGFYGYGGYSPYGYGTYLSNYGSIRIEVEPKFLRDEAQVYVNEAHVGDVDDFDGYFQRLSLFPGEYDIEVRIDGYETLKTRVFVRRGNTYKIRDSLRPVVAN